jgi:hypothetical protein
LIPIIYSARYNITAPEDVSRRLPARLAHQLAGAPPHALDGHASWRAHARSIEGILVRFDRTA